MTTLAPNCVGLSVSLCASLKDRDQNPHLYKTDYSYEHFELSNLNTWYTYSIAGWWHDKMQTGTQPTGILPREVDTKREITPPPSILTTGPTNHWLWTPRRHVQSNLRVAPQDKKTLQVLSEVKLDAGNSLLLRQLVIWSRRFDEVLTGVATTGFSRTLLRGTRTGTLCNATVCKVAASRWRQVKLSHYRPGQASRASGGSGF